MKNVSYHIIKTKTTALFKDIFSAIIPSNTTEWVLFAVIYACYALCGISLILSSDLLYNIDYGSGSYLGYDNIYHYQTSGGFLDVSHPFFVFFYFFKFLITGFLNFVFGAKSKILFCVLLMNFLVASGLIVLYKYLKNIILLSVFRSLLITVFCASFFTVIILSFTVESYPFSFLFLILSIFILSKEYIKEKKIKTSTVAFLGFMCGGITITNFLKPAAAFLLNKENWKVKLNKLLKIFILFSICVAGIYLLYSVKSNVADNSNGKYSPVRIVENIFSYSHFGKNWVKESFMDYWSSSFLVAPLTRQTVHTETVLRPSAYSCLWQYILSVSLLIIFIFSLFVNRKNILVKLLLCYISVDIIVHFIFGYGMTEAIIFGAHWLFLIPMSLGWLYSFKPFKKSCVVLDVYLCIFIVLLLYNNVTEILKSFFNIILL